MKITDLLQELNTALQNGASVLHRFPRRNGSNAASVLSNIRHDDASEDEDSGSESS
jgi:hypothetical protein